MAVDMKQTSRRLMEEAFGKGNLEVFDELCSEDFRAHDPVTGDADRSQEKENCRMYRKAFPDLKPAILASYAAGDVCVQHWRMTGTHQGELLGLAPMGARCTVEGITVDRFKGGRIVESWTQWDALGLMRQLGVAQPLGAGAVKAEAERRTHHA
ncbi:MAG TPA: ester cyclase [Anaeromyxobacteraceae bacterium]|nr:ester cyclase [Anaeromyxobacteraceae bacterium]